MRYSKTLTLPLPEPDDDVNVADITAAFEILDEALRKEASHIIIRDTQPGQDEQVAGDIWIDTSGGIFEGGVLEGGGSGNVAVQPTEPATNMIWADTTNPSADDAGFTWPDAN